jgi:hypothetical protein
MDNRKFDVKSAEGETSPAGGDVIEAGWPA